jgi:hypothetical protein
LIYPNEYLLEIIRSNRENDIVVEFDATHLTQRKFPIIIHNFTRSIIKESGEIGEFELDIFKITINHLEEYQNNLIKI